MIIKGGEEKPVFAPVVTSGAKGKGGGRAEQKPNLKRAATPQGDFRKQNLSPNTAEGKEALGLKDLAKLVGMKQANEAERSPEQETSKNVQMDNGQKMKKGKQGRKKEHSTAKKSKKRFEKKAGETAATRNNSPVTNSRPASPVHPEVEYQEKTEVEIRPTHHSLPLSTPVERVDHHASKDNSIDGFLAIKH